MNQKQKISRRDILGYFFLGVSIIMLGKSLMLCFSSVERAPDRHPENRVSEDAFFRYAAASFSAELRGIFGPGAEDSIRFFPLQTASERKNRI